MSQFQVRTLCNNKTKTREKEVSQFEVRTLCYNKSKTREKEVSQLKEVESRPDRRGQPLTSTESHCPGSKTRNQDRTGGGNLSQVRRATARGRRRGIKT